MDIKRRKSHQRERIYEIIKDSSAHPTALWIYEFLKNETPSISLANVYRNINILIEEGRVKSKDFGDGVEHYDAIIQPHYHFVCEKCKRISDLMIPIQDNITRIAQGKTRHNVLGHTIQFFGVCEECNK